MCFLNSIVEVLLQFLRHHFNLAKFFEIWSTVAGYDELCMSFEPIRNGEIF